MAGFHRVAAERITGATLTLLSSLVDKSLVRYDADRRFHMHELLRQYADEHLRAVPDEAERTHAAHRDFYLGYVADRFTAITGAAQREAIVEIAAELNNIRAAWRGAVTAGDSEALGRASHPLTLFYDFRARYREGFALLEEGARALRAAEPSPLVDRTLAAMLIDAVRLHHRLGHLPAMREALAESEARYAALAGPPPPGQMTDPKVWRALLALIDGHYAEAAQLSAEAIRSNTADDRPGNLPMAWWIRTGTALWQEDLDLAGEYAQRCAEASHVVGDRWELAYAHNMQGHVAVARGDYSEARRHYEASYAIREAFDDPEGMETSLIHLAKVASLQGDLSESEQLYQRGLAIARAIGDQISMANAFNGLGLTACARGDYAVAGQYIAEGLRLMAESGFMRLLLTLLTSAGDWLIQTGQPAEAVRPLRIARDNPASDNETRARSGRLLADVAAAIPAETFDAAVERGRDVDADEMARMLLPVLTAPSATDAVLAMQPAREIAPAAPPQQPASLVEPLTARELAVLRLIAAGRSNREIAEELFLAVNTVRSYSQQLYGKLGVGSRTQAVARARELGLLS